jgi:hypothetical protein
LNPGAITFPPYVKTIMIVNNAAQQPDSVGHTTFGYGTDTTQRVSADSMAYEFCRALGEALATAPIFEDVRLCEDTIRRDSSFYETKSFSAEAAEQLCSDYGVDAFISLDKLFFRTKMIKIKPQYDYVTGERIEIELTGEMRAYLRGQKEFYAVPFTDSLTWKTDIDFMMSGNRLSIADVEDAMRYFSNYEGRKLFVNFAPHWLEDSRRFYTSFASDWKRGAAYAVKNKWDEAARVWYAILKNAKNKKQQARLNANLALCREMTGDFAAAVRYAEKACRLYGEYAGEDDRFTKTQKMYLGVLIQRAENEKKLARQLGELP